MVANPDLQISNFRPEKHVSGRLATRCLWYTCCMKKPRTVLEFASLGGKARAAKLSKQRRLEISRAANEAKRLKRAGLDK